MTPRKLAVAGGLRARRPDDEQQRPSVQPVWLAGQDGAVRLLVRVQPGARRSAIVGMHGDRLKIAVQAPPVDGKANAALCEFVADLLGVAKGAVRVGAGIASRDKRLDIDAPLAHVRTVLAPNSPLP